MDIEGINMAVGLHVKGMEKMDVCVDIATVTEDILGTDVERAWT